MTAARAVTVGATEALSRRVQFRKAALAPWDPAVMEGWLYCVATAAERYNVDVHHTTLVINHHHTSATPNERNMPAFVGRLHQPMSGFLNALLESRGYDPLDQVWDGRQPERMRLLDPEAQMAQLVYNQLQHPQAGLVRHPRDMPGFTFSWDLWRPGRVVQCRRPRLYFDSKTRPDAVTLDFTPPPLLLDLFQGDVDKLIHHMKRLEHDALRSVLRARQGRRMLGPAKVTQIHPWDEPRTPREPRGRLAPSFRLGRRDPGTRQTRIQCRQEVAAFREANRQSVKAWTRGERDTVFPFGTDRFVRLHRARMAEAPGPTAIVHAPGPTLDDIRARHARNPRHRPIPERARAALERVRQGLTQPPDAAERVAIPASNPSTGGSLPPEGRPKGHPGLIQTLDGPRRTDPQHPPRRIVVHRSRPSRTARSGRRATDPPQE